MKTQDEDVSLFGQDKTTDSWNTLLEAIAEVLHGFFCVYPGARPI